MEPKPCYVHMAHIGDYEDFIGDTEDYLGDNDMNDKSSISS